MPGKIELQHVSFSYTTSDGKRINALKDISLTLTEGESVALIGQNGSGKSTLACLLNALRLPESGDVIVFGMDTREVEKLAAIRSKVGMVFQRPQDQIVANTVEEDIAFGPANLGLPPQEIRRRVTQALYVSGLQNLAERPSYMLSAGETQRLALAGVLAMQPRCVIFDETTAMLDPYGRLLVLEQARRLKRQGILVLFITHLMEEAARMERVIALHQGRLVMDGLPSEVFASRKQLHKYGLDLPPAGQAANSMRASLQCIPEAIWQEDALLEALPSYDERPIKMPPNLRQNRNAEIITVADLAHTYMRSTPLALTALRRVSLRVREGAVYGLIGPTGCGKSTLLQHINGLKRPQKGQVITCGINVGDAKLDVRALRRQVALAFQQPEEQFFENFVGDEIAFGPKNLLERPNLSETVQKAMQLVGLDFDTFKDRRVSTLSGGEKRKAALASALAAQPRVLLLDEPLAGLDPLAREEITASLLNLNRQGMTLIVSTHQFEGLIEHVHTLSLLRDGSDAAHGRPEKIFTDAVLLEKTGMIAPLAVRLAWELEKKGWPLPYATASLNALISMLSNQTEGEVV